MAGRDVVAVGLGFFVFRLLEESKRIL